MSPNDAISNLLGLHLSLEPESGLVPTGLAPRPHPPDKPPFFDPLASSPGLDPAGPLAVAPQAVDPKDFLMFVCRLDRVKKYLQFCSHLPFT